MPELLRLHLAHLRRRNARPATLRDRRDTILRLVTFLQIPLDQVTGDDLDQWQDSLKVAPSSVRTYTSHVRAFYRWLLDTGRIDRDPTALIAMPKVPPGSPRPVPLDDFRIALRTARGDLVAMLVLAGYLGLRVGEIAAMRGEDVVREAAGTFLIIHGKGGKERVIPLPDELRKVLAPWLIVSGPTFCSSTGRQVTAKVVTAAISGHFRSLGMPHTAHKLRHRAGTRLLQLTKDLRLVQEILGHANPGTTAIYTKVDDAYAVEAMGLLAGELADDMASTPAPPENEAA